MLSDPSKDPQGQQMNICPSASLEGHYSVYDDDHVVPIGTDRTEYAEMYSFIYHDIPVTDFLNK